MTSMSESASAAAPVAVPAEVVELQEKIKAQGLVVSAAKEQLKAGEGSEEDVKAKVAELLRLKKSLPAEFQEKKKGNKEKKEKGPKKPDERALKKAARIAEKERQAAERAAKKAGESADLDKLTQPGVLTETYGDLPMVQSRVEDRKGQSWTAVDELSASVAGSEVLCRGYVHHARVQRNLAFIELRQATATVQCVVSDATMAKWCQSLPAESIVDVAGKLVAAPQPIKACSQSDVELQVTSLFVVNRASLTPPFSVVDAGRTALEVERLAAEAKEKGLDKPVVAVGQTLLMLHRHLALRTPLQQAVMRVSSSVSHYFREYLRGQGFVEVQTPKLLGGSSEGGSEVFKTDYFGQECCLAQSPQLHKQILAACSGLERVCEVGPVFRAENSHTARHLCEFHGLDLEMAFKEHYHEVLDVFSDLFFYMFEQLNEVHAKELALVRAYYPEATPVVFRPSDELIASGTIKTCGTTSATLLLTFAEGIAMLREDGVTEEEAGDLEDLSTPVEKRLGALVKAKYGVDWYFLDKFPSNFRPFYTMPDPEDARYSNSYDFFLRGQELMSGAQRVHDPAMLAAAVAKKGVPVESLKFYIDAFKNGAQPHGGGGIGHERLVMLFCGLPNIRTACHFVRDPEHLTP